jgi:hypothetical protein
MKPKTIQEIVAIGYLRGWIKPPANPEKDTEAVYRRVKYLKDKESEQKKLLERRKAEALERL